MANFKDYDALTAGREEFVRRIGGEDIEFRKVLPAKLVLDIKRKADKMTEKDEEEFAFVLIEQVIGQEKFEHISEHLGMDQLMDLFGEVMVYYGLAEEDVGGKAEGEEPPSPSSESSETGEPSTPTSNASTPTPEEPSTMKPSTGSPSPQDSGNSPLALTS